MNDFSYDFLDKSRADEVLPSLFELFYENMHDIAPDDTADRDAWLSEVGRALTKAPRELVLIGREGKTVGFFMYYVNRGVFMMEEIQLDAAIQGGGAFRGLYEWLLTRLEGGIEYVEAFTHEPNTRSQAILRHFGLSAVEDGSARAYLHFRGDFETFKCRILRRDAVDNHTKK